MTNQELPMEGYAYAGMLHATEQGYHDAIVDGWIWGAGNSRSDAVTVLWSCSAGCLAQEIASEGRFRPAVTVADLVAAVHRLRAAYKAEDMAAAEEEARRQAELVEF